MDNGEDEVKVYCCSDVIMDSDDYVLYVFDSDDSTDYIKKHFDDVEVANEYRRGSGSLSSAQRKIVDKLTQQRSFLDSLIDEDEAKNNLPAAKGNQDLQFPGAKEEQDLMFGMTLEDYEAKFKKARKKFKEKRAKFESTAKLALIEAAKLYLGENHGQKYVEYRLKLNEASLGSVMYQIHTMEETLHSLVARVKVAGAHVAARDIEVLAQLNRIILDAQKHMYEYLGSIEQTLKELKSDIEMAEHGTKQNNTEEALFFFRGSKEFVEKLSKMKNQMADFIPTPSKNINLNPEAKITSTTDTTYEEIKEEIKLTENNPFSGYENSPKRNKRDRMGREDDEFNEDDD